jgi:hypothetical protein
LHAILFACEQLCSLGYILLCEDPLTEFFGTTEGIMLLGAMIGAGTFAAGVACTSIGKLPGLNGKVGLPAGDARSLAIQTVLALDDYVGACYVAIHDSPEFNPANDVEFAFHAPEPALTLPKSSDWQLLGRELGESVMWFSNRVVNLEHALDSLDLSSDGYDRFFERRIVGYSNLAASALDLIAEISAEFDLKMPEKPDYYKQAEGIATILQKVEGLSAMHAATRGGEHGGPSNVTPLFPRLT